MFSCESQRSPHRAWHRRSCSLNRQRSTLGLDALYLLQQCLIFAVDLDVTHFLEGDLLGSLVEEFEALGTLLAYTALEGVELGLMDLPGAFDFLVEAQLVADGDGSKHSLLWKKYGITYHLELNEKLRKERQKA